MTCKNKLPYRDELSAMIALSRIDYKRRVGNGRRKEVRCYRCPECGKYHLTSKALR